MIGYDYVRAVIGDVEEIVARPIEAFEQRPRCQREIFVRTKQGEMFRLVLQAERKKLLEFRREVKSNWLTPKVYTGKSMHEEEAENLA